MIRILLFLLGILALRRVVSWFSGLSSALRGRHAFRPASGGRKLEDELELDQPIEEAEFEELPQDRP